jgi:peptidoglycan/LPS O-acetylase OafA/YrhL
MNPSPPEPRHFAYIDAVRGWAFLGVLTVHTTVSVGSFPGHQLLTTLAEYGPQLFFLASAITLFHSMSNRRKVELYPLTFFYLRRFFRIAPLFWLAIFFYWKFTSLRPGGYIQIAPLTYVLTALFINGWHPVTLHTVVPGGWTIAVEMTFYLFLPLLFKNINSLKKAAMAVFIGYAFTEIQLFLSARILYPFAYRGVSLHDFYSFRSYWFPSQFIVFLIGILTYFLLQNPSIVRVPHSRIKATSGLVACGLLSVLAITTFDHGYLKSVFPLPIISCFLAGAILMISQGKVPGVVNPAITFIGKISYSCYLIHWACLTIALSLLGIHVKKTVPQYDAGQPAVNFLFLIILWVLTLLITIPLATLTFNLVETPGISFGRWLISWINKRSGFRNVQAEKVALVSPEQSQNP